MGAHIKRVAFHIYPWAPIKSLAWLYTHIIWAPTISRGCTLLCVVAQNFVDAHYVAIVGWPYAMCVDAHVGLGVVECGCPSCLCRDCPHVYVADHDSRGHSLAWGHVIVGPLAHLGPHIMQAHVTSPRSGHMGSRHSRNCGQA